MPARPRSLLPLLLAAALTAPGCSADHAAPGPPGALPALRAPLPGDAPAAAAVRIDGYYNFTTDKFQVNLNSGGKKAKYLYSGKVTTDRANPKVRTFNGPGATVPPSAVKVKLDGYYNFTTDKLQVNVTVDGRRTKYLYAGKVTTDGTNKNVRTFNGPANIIGPAPPAPVTDRLLVYYLCPASPSENQAALRSDAGLRAALANLNARYYTFAAGQSAASAIHLDRYAAPAVVILTPDGAVRQTLAGADVTAAGIAAAVKDLRGGN